MPCSRPYGAGLGVDFQLVSLCVLNVSSLHRVAAADTENADRQTDASECTADATPSHALRVCWASCFHGHPFANNRRKFLG